MTTATPTRKRAKAGDDDLEQKELPGIESPKNPKIRRLPSEPA